MKVYQAINKVQAALAKCGISKDRTNTQGSGYKFRGIDDVYNTLSPLLAEHGLCILPRMVGRLCEERQSKSGSALFYVTVEAEFDFVHAEDGSKHTVRTFGEAMDSGDKATNKAMSAAYKYAAFQAFAIPTAGDNDADGSTHEVRPGVHKPTDGARERVSQERRVYVQAYVEAAQAALENGEDVKAVQEYTSAGFDPDETVFFWTHFDSGQRSRMKKAKTFLDAEKAKAA